MLSTALGGAGVLARKRWRTTLQATTFIGELTTASFRSRTNLAEAAAEAL